MAIRNDQWTRFFATFEADPFEQGKRVESIDIKLVVQDAEGVVQVTDTQLQEGNMMTGHVPANEEMLKRETVADGTIIRKRHYNGVIRGKKTIAVPNRAMLSEEVDFTKRVTGGIDFFLEATQDLPGDGIQFSHQYRQRRFVLSAPLSAGHRLAFLATERKVEVDGAVTDAYNGTFHTIPAGFGLFNVELKDMSGEYHGSGRLACEVDTWLKGIGGERM